MSYKKDKGNSLPHRASDYMNRPEPVNHSFERASLGKRRPVEVVQDNTKRADHKQQSNHDRWYFGL